MRTKLSMQALAAVVAVASSLAWSAPARACAVDTDCTGAACGGEVCQWVNGSPMGCVAAGTDPQGSDGWCDTATDCKCTGATCGLSNHCSFTLPPDGGAAESDAAATATDAAATASDASAATEASTTTTSESDASTTTESDATAATGDSGTSEPTSTGGGKSSGCSIAGPGTSDSTPIAPLVGIALAGALLARKRRT
jgi:MYXO-CTERM domain-containing protein